MSNLALRQRSVAFPVRGTLDYYIRRLGLTTNCRLILDAGDAASYTSGQSWLDRSGNGYDFFRGANNSATTDDPTFNGTAGARTASEYWSFDGGDHFRYDTTNETWMQNIHKDNAVFTFAAWIFVGNLTAANCILGNSDNTAEIGFHWYIAASEVPVFTVTNGAGGTPINVNGGGTALTQSAWNFTAVSLNEATGASGGFFLVNNSAPVSFTSTYTSPSSSSATNTTEIGAFGGAATPFESSVRLGIVAAWEGRMLSEGELRALYQATRSRFGV